MKALIKMFVYSFLSCCIAKAMTDDLLIYIYICYFSMLLFASYEAIKKSDLEVTLDE